MDRPGTEFIVMYDLGIGFLFDCGFPPSLLSLYAVIDDGSMTYTCMMPVSVFMTLDVMWYPRYLAAITWFFSKMSYGTANGSPWSLAHTYAADAPCSSKAMARPLRICWFESVLSNSIRSLATFLTMSDGLSVLSLKYLVAPNVLYTLYLPYALLALSICDASFAAFTMLSSAGTRTVPARVVFMELICCISSASRRDILRDGFVDTGIEDGLGTPGGRMDPMISSSVSCSVGTLERSVMPSYMSSSIFLALMSSVLLSST